MRALQYWEKAQLLSLEYDAAQNLTGIHLKDLCQTVQPAVSKPCNAFYAEAPVMTLVSVPSGSPRHGTAHTKQEAFIKPSYTADDLRDFKERDSTSQLLFVAESYIGRPLTVAEMKSILYFSDCLHFSDDLIDYLLQYCVDRGKKDFKYMEAVALNWADSGITTPKQAEKFAARYDKSIYTIMKELGKNSSPTSKELEYINRWIKEYGFSADIITEACERTVLATDSHRFEYAEGILSNWKKEDVRRKSDIQRIDELYQKKKHAKPASVPGNRFNQFTSSDYDFAELEAKLLSK